ncbi:MAG: YciI family protein [Hyphomicrobium sp.]
MKVMVIVKATKSSEAGEMPSEQLLTEMTKFNEELVNAGIMLSGDGLTPSSKGARVVFKGGERNVIDGPFAETKEVIAGYWVWKVKDMAEAIAWAKRCPDPHPHTEETHLEIRPFFEAEDFGEAFTPELRAKEDDLRKKIEAM